MGGPAPAASDKSKTIETTTSLVLVDALLEDKKSGVPIDDLKQEDFLLRDKGKPCAQKFSSGKRSNTAPDTALVCVDVQRRQSCASGRATADRE